MTIKEKAMSGLRWTAGARFASQLITWGMTLFVIRILSPADYGLLAMATVVIAFLFMVSQIGLGPAIVQKAEIEPGILNKIFGLILAINLTICVLLFFAAPLIAEFYHEERLTPVIQVLSLQFVIAAFAVIPDALLQREMEFRKRSLVDLSGAVLGGLVTLVLAFKGYGVWALVAGTFTSQTWKTLGLNIVARIRIRPSLSFGGMKEYLVFGGHFSASTLLWFFFTQADVFIAGRWLGKEALGYYSVAMHLASLFNQRLAGVINQVAFPAFAHIQNDPKQVGDKVQLGARILSFFSFPCLWGISAVAPEIVMVILGPKWEQATLPLAILSLIMPLRVLGNFMPNALQGIGRTDVVLKNSAIACLIMPTAYLIGVNWGLIGLSYAWLFGAPLLFLDNTARSVRALGISLMDIFKCLWPGVVAGAIMYVTIIVARSLLFSGVISPASLLTLVVVGAAAYMVASLLLNRAGSREVLGLLKGMATFKKKAEPQ